MQSYRYALSQHLDDIVRTGLKGGSLQFEDHQKDALRSINAFLKGSSDKVANVLQACGTGKTWEEAALLEASIRAKGSVGETPDLLIITENSIRSGIMETLEAQGTDFCIWENGKKPVDRKVIVATIQTLQHKRNQVHKILSPKIPLIIGDEADLYITDQRMLFLSLFPESIQLGFSATGEWSDKRLISDIWGQTIYTYPLSNAIHDEVVVRPKYQLIESSVSMDALPKSSGDYPIDALDKILTEAEIYKGVVSVYDAITGDKERALFPTIVFVPSRALVRKTAAAFRERYGLELQLRWWTGVDTRVAALDRDIGDFNTGKVDVLIACDMGGRGMNLPNARLLIDAYPTKSLTKISQRHPRVMRKNRANLSQKPDCIIVQIVPTTQRTHPRIFPDLLCPNDSQECKGNAGNIGAIKNGHTPLYESLTPEQSDRLHRELRFVSGTHTLRLIHNVGEYQSGDLPFLGEDGSTEINGELWGTAQHFSKRLGVNSSMIVRNSQGQETRFARKRDITGRLDIVVIYSEASLRDYIQSRSGIKYLTEGFSEPIVVEGVEYYVKAQLVELCSESTAFIEECCRNESVRRIQGRYSKTNRKYTFFSIEDIKEVLAKKRGSISAADPDEAGICEDGVWYKTAYFLGKTYNISPRTIKSRIKDKKKIWGGKDVIGKKVDVYNEQDVKKLAEYLSQFPKANKEGKVIVDTGIYVGGEYIERVYGKPATSATVICKHRKLESIEVLNGINRVSQYFELSAVERIFQKV